MQRGLLTAKRQGKIVLYRADRDRITQRLADLQGYLSRCCRPTQVPPGKRSGR